MTLPVNVTRVKHMLDISARLLTQLGAMYRDEMSSELTQQSDLSDACRT